MWYCAYWHSLSSSCMIKQLAMNLLYMCTIQQLACVNLSVVVLNCLSDWTQCLRRTGSPAIASWIMCRALGQMLRQAETLCTPACLCTLTHAAVEAPCVIATPTTSCSKGMGRTHCSSYLLGVRDVFIHSSMKAHRYACRRLNPLKMQCQRKRFPTAAHRDGARGNVNLQQQGT
jgi:hypothetical protein